MDVITWCFWLCPFIVIILFGRFVKCFLQSENVITKEEVKSNKDAVNQGTEQISKTTISQGRRKRARKKQRQLMNADSDNNHQQVIENDNDHDENQSEINQDENDQFEDSVNFEEASSVPSIVSHVEDEQLPTIPLKQRQKTKNQIVNGKTSNTTYNYSKAQLSPSTKPQASVAPVKQFSPSINEKEIQTEQKNFSSNETSKSSQEQRSTVHSEPESKSKLESFQNLTDSTPRLNDFLPFKQQKFSSESQENSSRSTSNLFSQLLSIIDTNTLTSDQLEFLLKKMINKQHLNSQDWQRFIPTTKNENLIERLIEENHRNQVKLLTLEIQSEKSRVSELTKTNNDLSQTIRQCQQPTNQYHPDIAAYQTELKRLSDEHAQLIHQLQLYSMLPNAINELKQQIQVLDEQIRQLKIRIPTLQQEISDGQAASKQAAEIYKKSDSQKQDRIEQLISELNKYKKIEKELSTLREKYPEFEKTSKLKIEELTNQCEQLKRTTEEEKNISSQSQHLKQVNEKLKEEKQQLIEQLNRLTEERQQPENIQSS